LWVIERKIRRLRRGSLETEEVDFKSEPYQLSTERQKYSLLEDVTAFANYEGGLIIIGCRTESAEAEGDIVTELRLIQRNLINQDSYRSLCNEFIYPPIGGLKFFFFGGPAPEDRGLAVISVPKASEAERPHLIAHSISSDSERKMTTRYALVSRTGPRNSPFPVQSLHGLIRLGSVIANFEPSLKFIEQQIVSLNQKAELENTRPRQIELSQNRKTFLESLPDFLKDIGRANKATLVLAAFPSIKMTLPEIYDGASNLSATFDNAPMLRENGFGFSISQPAQIANGVARRKLRPSNKATQLSNSGRLLVAVPADENFLAWAQHRAEDEPIRYRSYILAEACYLFASYVKNVYGAMSPIPPEIDILVALRNSFVNGLAPLLGVARDNGQYYHSWIEPQAAPKNNLSKTIRVTSTMSTERLAFEIRACIYRRFGFVDEAIPYAALSSEGRITTADDIINPNRQ
jgi:hypothetical protein